MRIGLEKGIHMAVVAAEQLVAEGFVPYLPQLQALWNMISPKDDIYGYFLKMDFTWIDVCDALLRLPGESYGGDKEVAYCLGIGKPVFYSITDVRLWKEAGCPKEWNHASGPEHRIPERAHHG
jgi:hypothetical protein